MPGRRSHNLRALAALLATGLTACAVATTPPAKKAAPTQKVAAVTATATPGKATPTPEAPASKAPPVLSPSVAPPVTLTAPSQAPSLAPIDGGSGERTPLAPTPDPLGGLIGGLPSGGQVLSNNGSNLTLLDDPPVAPNAFPQGGGSTCLDNYAKYAGTTFEQFGALAAKLGVVADEAGFKAIDGNNDGSIEPAEACRVVVLIAQARAGAATDRKDINAGSEGEAAPPEKAGGLDVSPPD